MSSTKNVWVLISTVVTACVMTLTSVQAVNFEKVTCSSIANTNQNTYNAQVTCTATIARPGTGKWYSVVGQNCSNFCASLGAYNLPSPDGFSCVSGEVRGWSAIGVVNFAPTGCWHDCRYPEGFTGSVSVGGRCYSPGQKRDNDNTDTTLGCYCGTGDVDVKQIEVGIYAAGSATVSGLSSTLSGWQSVDRSVRNDKPGRMFDVLGVIPFGGTATITMTLNVQGSCGTSVTMSGTIASANQNLVKSKEVAIALPSCPSQCSDSIDNDGDGAIDYPADAGCSSALDNDESNPITPIAECVDVNQNGTLVAHFGYRNDASAAVVVAVGERNYFTTGAVDRGQPKTFLTGRVANVFTVPFASTDTLKWVVGDRTAAASVATERCQASNLGCIDTDNIKILSLLDGTARLQRKNVQLLAQKVQSLGSTGSKANKVESYKQLAESIYLEQWAAIWGTFPKVSRSCTACAAIDMSYEITNISSRAQRMYRLARQTATLLKAARGGKLRRDEQALVNNSSVLYDRFMQSSQSLPRFESKCS